MKKLNQKAFAPVEVLVVVLILIVVAFIGFLAWQRSSNNSNPESQAETRSIPRQRRGRISIGNGSGESKYTQSLKSRDGQICVVSKFKNNSVGAAPSFRFYIQEKHGSRWIEVRRSDEYNANNNYDSQCFDQDIYRGNTYRVRFDKNTCTLCARGDMSGPYLVTGFYLTKAQLEARL